MFSFFFLFILLVSTKKYSFLWCWFCYLFTLFSRNDNGVIHCTLGWRTGRSYNWFTCFEEFRTETSWTVNLVGCFRHLCCMYDICNCLQFIKYWNGFTFGRNWSGDKKTNISQFGHINKIKQKTKTENMRTKNKRNNTVFTHLLCFFFFFRFGWKEMKKKRNAKSQHLSVFHC